VPACRQRQGYTIGIFTTIILPTRELHLKGIEHNRLYRIAYVPIQYHVKVKARANPFLAEYDNYFFQRTRRREDLAKECKQITTFISNKDSSNSRVALRRDSL